MSLKAEAGSIIGWGLNNPAPDLFERIVVEPARGCTRSTCQHIDHDFAAPVYQLVPRVGQLVDLGGDQERTYYAVVQPGQTRFFLVSRELEPYRYHDLAAEVAAVPEWALHALTSGAH